jgi:hypothetical protein
MAYTTIDDPSAYFQTALWSGSGFGQSITNDGNLDLQPDWVWIKKRAGGTARSHQLYDSTRGVTKLLHSDANNAEETQSAGLTAFGSDGFTVGDNDGVDGSGGTYVAWQWKANGGTTSSNTDGSITSTVQANTTAGFSIVTYTGTGSTATVGHGLGAEPDMLIFKKRSAADNWYVYHSANTSAPETDYLVLDTTDATTDFLIWNDTAPTSSVFSISNAGVHASGQTMVCYAFTEKQGYSKFGSYTGNGNADGPFVYTGFKPAWLMIKKTNNTSQWVIHDTTRQEFNMQTRFLQANQPAAESTSSAADLDILSNGFKLRSTDDAQNGNGDTYIYMAFAESPFVSSEGVPTTAR